MSLSTQPFEPTHVLRTAVSPQPHPNTTEAPRQACAGEGRQGTDRRWDGVTRWLISLTTPRAKQLQQHPVSHGAGSTDLSADRKSGVQTGRGTRLAAGSASGPGWDLRHPRQ